MSTYVIEYAKSGRSKCMACKEPIAAVSLLWVPSTLQLLSPHSQQPTRSVAADAARLTAASACSPPTLPAASAPLHCVSASLQEDMRQGVSINVKGTDKTSVKWRHV